MLFRSGILQGEWDTDDTFKTIIDRSHRQNDLVVFDPDPRALVEKMIQLVRQQKEKYSYLYENNKIIK